MTATLSQSRKINVDVKALRNGTFTATAKYRTGDTANHTMDVVVSGADAQSAALDAHTQLLDGLDAVGWDPECVAATRSLMAAAS